ncbi:MAG TPA: flavin reductase family protein [Acidimicrobiia bacterium]|nr:flavin reductase family protein [Acidimicrobiia bacterium]
MIHSEHPFQPDPADREQARRFRGRLAAGVTIVTAGSGSDRTGLTVSSLFVVQGEPAQVYLVVGPTTDLWDVTADSGHFVIHICRYQDRQPVDVFAGLSPSPGGIFADIAVSETHWGPVLTDLPDRAYCRFESREEVGWSGLVVGLIEEVEVSALEDPMVHFRSRYRRLGPP